MPSSKKDYYEVLGIERDSTQEAIKKAYRKLALENHPDRTGGNDDRIKEINEAYATLSDDVKRRQYDMKQDLKPIYIDDLDRKNHYEYLNELLTAVRYAKQQPLAPGKPISAKETQELRRVIQPELEKLQNILMSTPKNDVDSLKLVRDNILKMKEAFKVIVHDSTERYRYDQKLLATETHYKYATRDAGRTHSFAANGEGFALLKAQYYELKGDALKTRILSDFKKTLQDVPDKESLIKVVDDFKKSGEYKVLEKGQGFMTRAFGLTTTSVKAFNEMVEERKQEFDVNAITKSPR